MFSTGGLFSSVPCPERTQCRRINCIYSHDPNAKQPVLPHVPVSAPIQIAGPSTQPQKSSSPSKPPVPHAGSSSIPAKRQSALVAKSYASPSTQPTQPEPPRKFQKVVGTISKVPTTPPTQITNGVPILRINAGLSKIAVPVRQAMIKTLYENFSLLYSDILVSNPTLASEHALAQEQEIYDKSNKVTYRTAIIQSAAALKKRPKPTSISHESVGTEGAIQKRRNERDLLRSLTLTKNHLDQHVMTIEDLKKWGFMTEPPEGPGGANPSDEGKVQRCERCGEQFQVKKKEEAEECKFHWGRAITNRSQGEKIRVWTCCHLPYDGEGCSRGPHVFSESTFEELHVRHPFTWTRPSNSSEKTDSALDVVAMDCEMIYSTGGVRVARVSVVDGSGKEIFDEHVRMDDGVEVIDFNTRFSGITDEDYNSKAILDLRSIRESLDAYINQDTIIIGHALDNDLKTLRMVHHRCVDTVVLFPHRAGPPYRRSLRDLARENLGRIIQLGGGTSGHSSVEDSIATLDLVRYFVLNNPKTKKDTTSPEKLSISK